MVEFASRFSEARMYDVMGAVASQLGVPFDDAKLLRLANNAVFALPQARLVIRVNRSRRLAHRVHKVIRLATWFADIDAPAIRLFPGVPQPIAVNGILATVWRLVPRSPIPLTGADLGEVLRTFHSLGSPPVDLPQWNPVDDSQRRIAEAEYLTDDQRAFLSDWCQRLAPRIADFVQYTAGGLIHGDAHVGNLIRDLSGRSLLCDFDSTCLGPTQVDLAALAVSEIRFGRRNSHLAMARTYGYDVTADLYWPLLREARELKMVTGALPYLGSGPGVTQEFELRLRSIVEADNHVKWTPFAELTTR